MKIGLFDKMLAEQLDLKTVHVWVLDSSAIASVMMDEYVPWLTPAELQRYERLHLTRHKRKFLIGQIMLRTILSSYENKLPGEWVFETNGYGKPKIATNVTSDSLHFNVSHSGDFYAAAVSRHELTGIDVELVTRERCIKQIADRHFSKTEVDNLLTLPEKYQLDRFYSLWTLKEAYIKARGMGLAIPLRDFGFDFKEEDDSFLDFWVAGTLNDDASRWQFWQFAPVNNYRISLSVSTASDNQLENVYTLRLHSLSEAEEDILELTRCC